MARPERLFWFRLAMRLGMSVRRAQDEVDSQEFSEWMAYNELEPFGEERADMRSGIVAAVMANAFRGKNQRAFKPSDFMPQYGKRKKGRSAEQLKTALFAIAAQQNEVARGRH